MARIIMLDLLILLILVASVSAVVWAWKGTRKKVVYKSKKKKNA